MRSANRFSATGFDKLNPEKRKYLDGVLALLVTAAADKALLDSDPVDGRISGSRRADREAGGQGPAERR